MTVELLKAEIVALSEEDRQSLAIWLGGLGADEWDQEMERDFAAGGRGESMVEKVKADIAAGKFRRVEDFCADSVLDER